MLDIVTCQQFINHFFVHDFVLFHLFIGCTAGRGLNIHARNPMDRTGKFGQEHGFFHGFCCGPKDTYFGLSVKGAVTGGAVAYALSQIFGFARKGRGCSTHGTGGEYQTACLDGIIGCINHFGVDIVTSAGFVDINHEHLRPFVTGSIFRRLHSHLIQQFLTTHASVDAGIIGNMTCNRKSSHGGILVNNDRLEIGSTRIESTGTSSRTSTNNGHITLNHFHFAHTHVECGFSLEPRGAGSRKWSNPMMRKLVP
mmetsp:Transcript_28553/g.52136  ORF Transcript_28553/g.52136 Transcript_28553/m.52136 type:complete len:254 (+) Transcript_28553:469-1230(+)